MKRKFLTRTAILMLVTFILKIKAKDDKKLTPQEIADIERVTVQGSGGGGGGGGGSGLPWYYYSPVPYNPPPTDFKQSSPLDNQKDRYPTPDPIIDPNRPPPAVPPAPQPQIKDKMSWSDWKKIQNGRK